MRRLVALALICALAVTQAFGFGPGGSAPPPANPYALFDGTFVPYLTTTSKTQVTPTPAGGDAMFLILGQSLCVNVGPTPFTPTNPTKVIQLHIYDGKFYQAADPLLGTGQTNGNWITRMGDKLIIDAKYTRVFVVPICIGSTAVADWGPAGQYGHRVMVALKLIRASGFPLTGILWEQGQQDATNGTSQANWQLGFGAVRSIATGLGYGSVKWLVPIDTMNASVTNATIAAAQAAVVDNITVFAGPNVDTGVPTAQRQDGTHPNDTGEATLAGLWTTKVEANF